MESRAPEYPLAPLFRAVAQVLAEHRLQYNQADEINANHGDHMAEIFDIAARAADEYQSLSIAEAMEQAAFQLTNLEDNGSAQEYARGLTQLAAQLRKYNLETGDLVAYVRSITGGNPPEGESTVPLRKAEIVKALLGGLAAWRQVEDGVPPPENPVDMGFIFDIGAAYMQAKQRGGTPAQVIAAAAAEVSPLADVPHRLESGRQAIEALLEAMQSAPAYPKG
jgi:hypothetical protein